jgi:hypothetical protein
MYLMSMLNGVVGVVYMPLLLGLLAGKMALPFNIEFLLLNMERLDIAVVVFAWIYWAQTFSAATVIFFDVTTYAMVSMIAVEFRLLAESFRTIDSDKNELRKLLAKHCKMTDLSDR